MYMYILTMKNFVLMKLSQLFEREREREKIYTARERERKRYIGDSGRDDKLVGTIT